MVAGSAERAPGDRRLPASPETESRICESASRSSRDLSSEIPTFAPIVDRACERCGRAIRRSESNPSRICYFCRPAERRERVARLGRFILREFRIWDEDHLGPASRLGPPTGANGARAIQLALVGFLYADSLRLPSAADLEGREDQEPAPPPPSAEPFASAKPRVVYADRPDLNAFASCVELPGSGLRCFADGAIFDRAGVALRAPRSRALKGELLWEGAESDNSRLPDGWTADIGRISAEAIAEADAADLDRALADDGSLPAVAMPGWEPESEHVGCNRLGTWGHEAAPGLWHWKQGRLGDAVYGCPTDLSTGKPRDRRWRNGYTTRQARRVARRFPRKKANHVVLSPPPNWEPIWDALQERERWRRAQATPLARRRYAARREREGLPAVPPLPPKPEPGPAALPDTDRVEAARQLRKLRAFLAWCARFVGLRRFCFVPHHLRCVNAERDGGHDGLHVHAAAVDRISPNLTAPLYNLAGVVVKGLGFRTVRTLLLYELHHVARVREPSNPEVRRTRAARLADRARVPLAVAEARYAELDLRKVEGAYAERRFRRIVRLRDQFLAHERAAEGVNPASWDNLRYSTEAVTWYGPWEKALEPDSEGVLCPVCDDIIPGDAWYELIWEGSGPPPEGEHGTGGAWRRAERHVPASAEVGE